MLSWTRWAMWKHIIFAILGTLVVAGGLSACDPIVPDVVGQALPDAIQRLENSGYSQLRVIDDSGATITRTHYEDGYKVTTQDKSGSDIPTTTTITLTVTESHITCRLLAQHRAAVPFPPIALPTLPHQRPRPSEQKSSLRQRPSLHQPPLLPRTTRTTRKSTHTTQIVERRAQPEPHHSTWVIPAIVQVWTETGTASPASRHTPPEPASPTVIAPHGCAGI